MKWSELDARAKDALVAEKVFDRTIERSMTWGRLLMFREGDTGLTEEIPPYTTSMDAAWLVLQHMVERYCVDYRKQNDVWDRFCEASWEKYMESGNVYRWVATWTPEMLCKAALIAIDVDVEV
jgi:hypothetical protein